MLIALPTESTTPLSAIIPHISTKTIGSWMTSMVAKRVQVILPKYVVIEHVSPSRVVFFGRVVILAYVL